MINFFGTLIRIYFHAFRSKRTVLSENALLNKENEILARKMGKKRVHFNIYDKLFFVVLNRADEIKHRLRLVKPERLLYWQRTLAPHQNSIRVGFAASTIQIVCW